ncbi:MAG: VanW family protein [Anaerolineales bacterium]|nr:VanW family protein [Anaerolineales bacterium]
MNHQFPTSYQRRKSAASPRLDILAAQIMAALLCGALLYLFFSLVGAVGYSLIYSGKIYPGVTVEGINLSGLEIAEASERLAESISYPANGKIAFRYDNKVWTTAPKDVGLFLDAEGSAALAYQYGRQEGLLRKPILQVRALFFGANIPAQFVFDEQSARYYLSNIAAQIDTPAVEASLAVNGVEVNATPGQIGYALDISAAISDIYPSLQALKDGEVVLSVTEFPPDILDASAQAEKARQILSASLVLQIPKMQEGDPEPWVINREQLAQMLTIFKQNDGTSAQYQVVIETDALETTLAGIAPQVERQPEDARFVFNDETRQLDVIQASITGRSLNIPESIKQINEGLASGQHRIDLAVDISEPGIPDTMTAEELGITELVGRQISYFYGSSAERIQNIKTASARFHGILVAPHSTFSMVDTLGDVSLDTGYAEALIIFGNQTIKGVGGGVCQVSTTLFRTAFFAGYPIVERYPHAYRVSYYEYEASGSVDESMAGLDATVFAPVVDFKFTNDTPYWLLMETYVNAAARTLTWKFYSTSDGREVNWETSGLTNIVEPGDPVLKENPDLDKNEVEQVEWEVAGADVTVNRTVYKNGEVYFEDSYYTHYIPWQAVYEYGPGTNLKKLTKNIVPMP